MDGWILLYYLTRLLKEREGLIEDLNKSVGVIVFISYLSIVFILSYSYKY